MKTAKAWLKTKGMTQGEFARRLGTDRHQVSRWMRGHKMPSLQTLVRMSRVTGLPIEELMK